MYKKNYQKEPIFHYFTDKILNKKILLVRTVKAEKGGERDRLGIPEFSLILLALSYS